MVRHALEPGSIALYRQPLEAVAEVTIVVVIAHGKARNYLCWQLRRWRLPLLCGVVADERLIKGSADQRDPAFFEVLCRIAVELRRLFGDKLPRLIGTVSTAEKLIYRAQVDGKRVDLAAVI